MDEVQSLERMILDNATEHVHSAILAGVSLDCSRGVDDCELVLVGRYGEVGNRHDTDDREEGSRWLPAFRAAASVVVSYIARNLDLDFVAGAVAFESAAGEIGVAFLQAVVDEWVKSDHFCLSIVQMEVAGQNE